jgi:hypothetical protein
MILLEEGLLEAADFHRACGLWCWTSGTARMKVGLVGQVLMDAAICIRSCATGCGMVASTAREG